MPVFKIPSCLHFEVIIDFFLCFDSCMLANCGGISVIEHYFSNFDLLFAELDDVALFERISLGAVKSTWLGTVLVTSHSSFCKVYC